MSSALKDFVKSTAAYKRVGRHFRAGTIDRAEFLRGFIKDNGWMFSQPKSGTNLVCSTIAFYNAERLGITDYSFGDRYRLGLLHGSRLNAQTIQDFNAFRLLSTGPVFVRTHDDVPDARPRFLINVTRNVLDNLVSVYHFIWKPRGLSVASAIQPMVGGFAKIHSAQKDASKRAEKSFMLRYEDMKADPAATFTAMFADIYGEVDAVALAKALEAGSPERFKAWEKEAGAFVPEKTAKSQSSFIRSGRIGEGAEFFTEDQKQQITDALRRADLSSDPDVVL